MEHQLRAIIFANGILGDAKTTRSVIRPGDVIIAADGGARHCSALDLIPDYLIGDFDSISPEELAELEDAGVRIIRHPAKKDYTDLELALLHARTIGAGQALVFGALGARWDQTLANLLLPASLDLADLDIRLQDGKQEIMVMRGGGRYELRGDAGDIVSLIPLGADVHGVTTWGLEYPLKDEPLYFGATRGISNVLLGKVATVSIRQGILLCAVIHQNGPGLDITGEVNVDHPGDD